MTNPTLRTKVQGKHLTLNEHDDDDDDDENPSNGRPVLPCGQTDRHDEANSRFAEFCGILRNFANAPKNEALHSSPDQPAGQRPDQIRLAFVLRTPI